MALTDDAHRLIEQYFERRPKTLAIDATCGNGNDTLFLAKFGFEKVIGFDIQPQAIDVTNQRLAAESIQNAELILDSHQHMANHIEQAVSCVMFNLGYLPSADKSITTNTSSSLAAINAACELLKPQGMISLMCYPGTDAGAEETKAIKNYLDSLGSPWVLENHLAVSPKPTAPILFTLSKD